VSYSSSPLRDDDGGIIGLVVVFRDITERKRGELALRRRRGELESKLAATQHLQTISNPANRSRFGAIRSRRCKGSESLS
jgi:hypothetical protein